MSARNREWIAAEFRAEYGVPPSSVPPFERVPVTGALAFDIDLERVDVEWDRIDEHISRTIAQGRIIARLAELRQRDPVRVFVVEHPSLPAGSHFVVFSWETRSSLYRSTRALDDARAVLASGNVRSC